METIRTIEQAQNNRRWSLPTSLFGNFKSEPDYLRRCLERMNQHEFAKTICKVNLMTSSYYTGGSEMFYQGLAILNLYKDGIISHRDKERIGDFYRTDEQAFSTTRVFARTNLIELLRSLLITKVTESVSISESARRGDFMRVLAMASEIAAHVDISSRFRISDSWEEMLVYMLPLIRRTAQLGTPTNAPIFYVGRAKLLLVDLFIKQYPEYSATFEHLFGFSADTYLKVAAGIIKTMLPRAREVREYSSFQNAYEYSLQDIHQNCGEVELDSIRNYLDQFSQTIDDLASRWRSAKSALDLKPILDFPILRLENEKYLAVDELILCESIAIGPLFKLLKKVDVNEAFAKFGKSFQRYVSLQLDDYHHEAPESMKPHLLWVEDDDEKESEPFDLWIRYEKEIVLGEIKGGFLRDADLIHPDSLVFLKALRESYVCTSENKPKGIGQLVRSVKLLIEGKLNRKFEIDEEASIFPVLLVHDQYLRSPQFGILFSGEFWNLFHEEGVPKDGYMQIGRKRLYSPIVLTIRDLEHYQSLAPKIPISSILNMYSELDPMRLGSIRYVEGALPLPKEDDKPRICQVAREIAGDFV